MSRDNNASEPARDTALIQANATQLIHNDPETLRNVTRPLQYPTTTKTETMSQERKRSTSRTRVSRPTTPLRPSSRSSFRESAKASTSGGPSFPLNAFEPAFAELSDAMSDLEANMMHFQLMHESLARFSESFASFMYGLNMNAFCVDYPEVRTIYSSVLTLAGSVVVLCMHAAR